MPLRSFALTLCLLLSAVPALRAQSTEKEIFARLKDEPFFLRGFWTDDKLAFDAAGQPRSAYQIGSFTVCGFRADSVKLEGGRLHIAGVRIALRFDNKGNPSRTVLRTGGMFSKDEKVSIDIDNADGTDFRNALDGIFANGFAELLPTLPDFWQPYLRRQISGAASAKTTVPDESAKPSHVGGNITPPRLLSALNPRYSEIARRTRLSGNVEVYLIVEPNGTPSHIQIVHPLGLELDEAAAQAVFGYRFAPATRDGEPVKVDLYVEVNFRIF